MTTPMTPSTNPARDEAVQPITPERLAEVRERFNAIPHADPDSLTGHVKGMLALIDSLASAPAPASGVDAVAELERYCDRQTAMACSEVAQAETDGDDLYANRMRGRQNAYSDVTKRLRGIAAAALEAEKTLVDRIKLIAEDFEPSNDSEAVLALGEMREALHRAVGLSEESRSALSPAATPVSEAEPEAWEFLPREMSDEMMDAGQTYLNEKSLNGRFTLPGGFNWHEFWRVVVAQLPALAKPSSSAGEDKLANLVERFSGAVISRKQMERLRADVMPSEGQPAEFVKEAIDAAIGTLEAAGFSPDIESAEPGNTLLAYLGSVRDNMPDGPDLRPVQAPSPAGGWPSSGGLNADWVAMVLAEDARIEDGRLANGPYLAVKIADAADLPPEVDRLRTALANVRDHTRETSTATMAIGALSGSRISSPAGGDVREVATDLATKIATDIMNRPWARFASTVEEMADRHGEIQEIVDSALSPSTSAAEPVAWRAVAHPDTRMGTMVNQIRYRLIEDADSLYGEGRWDLQELGVIAAAHPAPAAVESAQGLKEAAKALDELETLVNEYDRTNSDWYFRRTVIRGLIVSIRASLATEEEG